MKSLLFLLALLLLPGCDQGSAPDIEEQIWEGVYEVVLDDGFYRFDPETRDALYVREYRKSDYEGDWPYTEDRVTATIGHRMAVVVVFPSGDAYALNGNARGLGYSETPDSVRVTIPGATTAKVAQSKITFDMLDRFRTLTEFRAYAAETTGVEKCGRPEDAEKFRQIITARH